jgi:hypothetical protein
MIDVGGEDRLICFTTGRVLQYAANAPLGRGQLLADRPFLAGGRQDADGRNYGLVQRDPAAPYVALISGTSTFTMFSDMQTGKMAADPMGGITRHVAVYNYQTNQIEERLFSVAHAENEASKYDGRIVFPAHALLATSPRTASRLGYNEYRGGHWYFHISRPGSVADETMLRDLFVWDIRDLDNDGQQEIVASPARYANDPDVAGYYFVKRETMLLRWDERGRQLVQGKRYPGAIPHVMQCFTEGNCSSSLGYLYPVLTTMRDGQLELILNDRGTVRTVPY